jgi:circadian clock protein KaiC
MERLTTGIDGLDQVLGGGLPAGDLVMVGGPPGAGKTVLCEQIAFHRAAHGGRSLIFTTLSEPYEKLIRHARGFAWFDMAAVGSGVHFLSLYEPLDDGGTAQALEIVMAAVHEHAPDLVVLDAFRGVRDLIGDELALRRFVYELGGQLGALGITVLITGEYAREEVERYVEFTIADGILHLDHTLVAPVLRRTLDVVKMRGTAFLSGRHTLRIDGGGVEVYPRQAALAPHTAYAMGAARLSTGIADLDRMLGGGIVERSFNLLVGTPGVGKTVLALQFLAEGAWRGERGVMMSLDESGDHLEQKATAFGLNRDGQVFFDGDRLQMLWAPAVETEVDVLSARVRKAVEGRGVKRVVLDAMANLEGVLGPTQLNDFIISTMNSLRGQGITVLVINDLAALAGGVLNVGGFTFAATADNIVLMRQVEIDHRLHFTLAVIKLRDSVFDPEVRLYSIEPGVGLRLGEALRDYGSRAPNILSQEPGGRRA